MPRLVAVILHFRTPEATLKCLASLHAERVTEVVLVDNSEDGGLSIAAMQKQLLDMECLGLRIHLLDFGRNLGFAAGVNRGIACALESGPASILVINSDVQVHPNAIRSLTSVIEGGAGVAFPLVEVSGREEKSCFYQRHLALVSFSPLIGSEQLLNGVCLLISERVVSADMFDETFFFYGEDVELGARLRSGGVVLRGAESAIITHQKSTSARNGSLFYEYHVVRGHWLLAKKLAKNKGDYIFSLLGRCLVLPARAVFRAVRGRSVFPLAAFLMATIDVIQGRLRPLTPRASRISGGV